MQATSVGIGWIQTLLLVLGGSGLLGMPPGDRDPAFIKAAPASSLVYLEWSARGPGKSNARGIDGLVADPEIQQFLAAVDQALQPMDEPNPDGTQSDSGHLYQLASLMTSVPGYLCVTAAPLPARNNELIAVPTPAELLSRFQIAIVVDAGPNAAATIDAMNKAYHLEIPNQPKRFLLPGLMNQKVVVHQEGARLILGIGEGTLDTTLAGLQGGVPGLDSNSRFASNWQRVKADRVGSVAWIDLKGTADVVLQSVGPAGILGQVIIKGSGADALDCVISSTGVVEGQVIQRTFLATAGQTNGVLMFAKGNPLRLAQLAHIPADSDVVLAASLDLGQTFTGVRDLIARTNPLVVRVFDEAIRESEAELNLNLAHDVFPAFGNGWTAFSSPSEGGLVGSSLIVGVEVRDHAKASKVFDTLMQLVDQSLATGDADTEGPQSELHKHDFLGTTICHIKRRGLVYGLTPTISPTFCLTEKHILFAVHPQAMKAHLRHIQAHRPGFDTVAREKLSLTNQDLLLASYVEGARSIQVLAGLLPFLGEALVEMNHMNGIDFDAFAIPSLAALAPYAGDVTLTVTRQADGLLAESRNPHVGAVMLGTVGWLHSWMQPDYDIIMQTRRQQAQPGLNAGLGAPAGLGAAEGQVVPVAAEKPAQPAQEGVGAAAARRVAPLLIKALVPDNIQPAIPPDVFRILSEPPSPEALQRREERRKELEERRRIRAERRKGLPPTP